MPKLICSAVLASLLLGGFFVGSASAQSKKLTITAAEMYAVPAGNDLEALQTAFIRLISYKPMSPKELELHKAKFGPALQGICQKIVATDRDPQSVLHKAARHMLVTLRMDELIQPGASDDDRKVFLGKFAPYLAGLPLGEPNVTLATQFASGLEAAGSFQLAAEAYAKLGEVFATADDAEVARGGRKLLGGARRLGLEGQPMPLTGTTLDGQPFDIASLKGKVVLVDFWATWCPPCVKEYPNIKKHYDALHDQGFEVVGISLDKDRAALETFVAEKKVPWTILHEPESSESSAVVEYGIFGIPRMFLIDREGKVVSINAWGENLSRLLPMVMKQGG
ncbi:MAG: TlpA disulfide reductase family protein [Pirellulaceae bacterium]|nr:TlpA disulfide reductase family protein [Pirellulaceae bacterium]